MFHAENAISGFRRAPNSRRLKAAPDRGQGFALPWDAIVIEPLADHMVSSGGADTLVRDLYPGVPWLLSLPRNELRLRIW